MAINTYTTDPDTGKTVKVDDRNRLAVENSNLPPINVVDKVKVFRDYFRVNTGSSDMRVNGSSAFVDFTITSSNDADRYITTLSFVIADVGASLNEFGNIGTLTNGVEVFYEDLTQGSVTIADSLTTNWDFVRLCVGTPAFGDGGTVFRANNVSGSSEAYIPTLDLRKVFGLPFGIKIPKQSTLKLVIRINDNVTGVDQFDCIAYGFERAY